jgi:hypothetical protein
MKKVAGTFILLLILSFFTPSLGWATPNITDPEENKFGIHILEPSDLTKAAELVNSNGGDWGYITVVIREDDMNSDKWQAFMDTCREKHLIPLVRIATHLEGSFWVIPKTEDSEKWANFLGNLNWPIKNQYLIVFNEPNHDKEWGGKANPKEYVKILDTFIQTFKAKDPNFKVLNAGFDLAAGNSSTTREALQFWQEMDREIPGIFNELDGWVSHSYPNHGYLGRPWDTGRTSIRGYEWELWLLKNRLGVKKDLPVFITETGWPAEDKVQFRQVTVGKRKKVVKVSRYYDRATVANYFKYAFENVWLKEGKIKAVTPFVLNYSEPLFANFSWLDKEGIGYPQFGTVKSLPKSHWWPEQEERFEIESISLPPFIPTNSTYEGSLVLKNVGQSILGEKGSGPIKALADKDLRVSDLILPEDEKLKPNQKISLEFSIKTATSSGVFEFGWREGEKFRVKVIPASVISQARFNLWQKIFSFLKSFAGR